MDEPTTANIREWSQVDFDDIGYPTPEGLAVDSLARILEGSILWVQRVTGRIYADLDVNATSVDDRWTNWAINQSVQMQTEYKAFVSQPDIPEGWSDFNLIQNFSAGEYSENRRSPNSRTRRIHPWTDLADLLFDLMTDDVAAKHAIGGPGYAAVEPSWDVGQDIIDARKETIHGPFGAYRPPWDNLS